MVNIDKSSLGGKAMSDGKTILVDVSRCTGCRAVKVACKQWNELPATDTVQTGSYHEPARYERRYLQDRPVPRRAA